jgi:hypothetical protein
MVALPGFRVAGATAVMDGMEFCRFMVMLALAVLSCWLTAVTWTTANDGRMAGAV